MDFIKNLVTNKINLLGFFIAFIGAYLLFPAFFENPIYPIQPSEYLWMSLDPSWVSALNYVNLKELIWGKEFTFTYGPLSYLSTRVGWGQNRISFLLFDFFYFINFFLVFFITFKKSANKYLTSIIIIVLGLLLPVYFGSANSFILLAFLLFWIRYSLDNNNFVTYIFQTIILILLFFIKLNTGIVSFLFFIVAILYKIFFRKDNRILLTIYLISPFIIIFLLSNFLNVSIYDYTLNGIDIVRGFNEIMYLPSALLYKKFFAILILIISSSILVYRIYYNRKDKSLKDILIFFLFGASIFILYKQAFVRADDSHILEFFNYAILIIICIYDFHVFKMNKYLVSSVLVMVSICIYFTFEIKPDFLQLGHKFKKTTYFEGLQSFTKISGVKLFPNNNSLPQRVIGKVGISTIDSYPWNTQILLENKLNFHPRPVFQSYTAYTKELEELNFNHYNSTMAPKFVLYDYGSVDDRYPLFDEPKMNLILQKNYKCIDTFTVNKRLNLLLEKQTNRKIKIKQTKEYAMYLDSPLIPKKNVFYEVFLYNSIKGSFVSLLEYSPEIVLEIETFDGNKHSFKTSKSLLESGLFSTNFISNTNDFLNTITSNKTLEINKIKAYYFRPKQVSSFKDKIRIKEYEIID